MRKVKLKDIAEVFSGLSYRRYLDDNGMKCKNDDHYSEGGDYDNSMVNNHNKKLLNHSGLMDIDVDDIRMNYV